MEKVTFHTKGKTFENKVVFEGNNLGIAGLITYTALMLCFAALQHNALQKRLAALQPSPALWWGFFVGFSVFL